MKTHFNQFFRVLPTIILKKSIPVQVKLLTLFYEAAVIVQPVLNIESDV